MAANDRPIIIIKKKGHGKHGHHGGAWKVAYADFVTAMMAFFLVMWLLGADEETKAKIEQYFKGGSEQPISTFQTNPSGGEKVNTLDEKFARGGRPMDMPAGKVNTQTAPDQELIQVKEILEETISLELGQTSLEDKVELIYDSKNALLRVALKDAFEEGHSELKREYIPLVQRIARAFATSTRLIRIEGHTDRGERSDRYPSSWELSAARAGYVAQYWVQNYPEINPSRLQIAGNSNFRAIAENKTSVGRASNRRVEFLLLNIDTVAR